MTTNNQAALQAAATVFAGGRGHTAPADVKGMAQAFKGWLDAQDAIDQSKTAVAKVEQAETVSHHISCSSRRAKECNCSALPYFSNGGPSPKPGPYDSLR